MISLSTDCAFWMRVLSISKASGAPSLVRGIRDIIRIVPEKSTFRVNAPLLIALVADQEWKRVSSVEQKKRYAVSLRLFLLRFEVAVSDSLMKTAEPAPAASPWALAWGHIYSTPKAISFGLREIR